MVHHITSGRADKNIGLAINTLVEGLPLNDWVCLRDIDTIPMDHINFFYQCEAIAQRGEFDLVGCMTNRSGLDHQLWDGKISENTDIAYHMKIGKEATKHWGINALEIDNFIAGFFMLFPVKAWIKAGGFREGSIRIPLDKSDAKKTKHKDKFFDWHFCNDVTKAGGKIGLAKGIYVFHLYRLGSENPKKSTGHLR